MNSVVLRGKNLPREVPIDNVSRCYSQYKVYIPLRLHCAPPGYY